MHFLLWLVGYFSILSTLSWGKLSLGGGGERSSKKQRKVTAGIVAGSGDDLEHFYAKDGAFVGEATQSHTMEDWPTKPMTPIFAWSHKNGNPQAYL